MPLFLAIRFHCPAGDRYLGARGVLTPDLSAARLFPTEGRTGPDAEAVVAAHETAARFASSATVEVLRQVGAPSLDQAAEILGRPDIVAVIRRTVVELAPTEPSA